MLNEKRQVLAGLSDTRSVKALELAGSVLDDPALKQEAQAAVLRIGERIREDHSEELLIFLKKIHKDTDDEDIREWAQEILNAIESQ